MKSEKGKNVFWNKGNMPRKSRIDKEKLKVPKVQEEITNA
jgi:hypothetical protein